MKRRLNVLAVVLTLFSAFSASAAFAQDPPETPLQVDVEVRMPRNLESRNFKRVLEGGTATIRGRVDNIDENGTVVVTMRFDYRSGADIALDEIIDRIIVTIESQQGEEFAVSTIDPNDIHLNPNRAPLFFSTTLYRSPVSVSRDFRVRIRVYGNYE
jgi:hypothetical protein